MSAGLLAALGAALAYGLGTALQAVGARRALAETRSVLRQPWTIAGTALDGVGLLLSLLALRALPLFVVQAVVSANLAVAALAARLLLGQRLRRSQQGAVLAATVGLAMVGLAATPETGVRASLGLVVALEGAACLTALVLVADLARPAKSGRRLAVWSGVGFSVFALSARTLPDLHPVTLLGSPIAWAGLAGGGAAFLALLRALERSPVAQVMAPLVVIETVLPSIVGVLALGDRPAAGTAPLAIAGFALAVTGAVLLAATGDQS